MEPVDRANLLYIDTESDPTDKRLLSVQYRFRGEHGIVERFDRENWEFLASLWGECSAVVMFNAPYDLGALAGAFPGLNSWRWVPGEHGSYWRLSLFGHAYKVRRISGFRNLIKPFKRTHSPSGIPYPTKSKRPSSAPVIDLLKLWSILIDDGRNGSISLKSLIKRELGLEPIVYSEETALTDAYRYQDVDCLESLFHIFLDRVSGITDLASYTPSDWGFIKTPATFTKKAYEDAYPELANWRKANIARDEASGLVNALEEAYHGGITIALRRGTNHNTAWFDLKGAYASVIENLNTDRWLLYRWQELDPSDAPISSRTVPVLCKVRSTAVIKSINKSLKLFTVDKPYTYWIWNFDISMLRILFPDATIDVLSAYLPVPLNDCSESLPGTWNKLKDTEKETNGKTTLYDYFKFLSNTSYGIKAQRNPFTTPHTNMAIAGIITSRVHLALLEMVDECRSAGMRWLYSDTDSVCMEVDGSIPPDFEARLNRRLEPLRAECEGCGFTTRILSLKRYTSVNGTYLNGKKAPDKVKLHGKGRYRITQNLIREGIESGITSQNPLVISQLAANTEITMKQLVKAFPPAKKHIHPFAFQPNIPTDRTLAEWFAGWYAHIDTKTTYPDSGVASDEFNRDFWHFPSCYIAVRFWGERVRDTDIEPEDLAPEVGLWDEEVSWAFDP